MMEILKPVIKLALAIVLALFAYSALTAEILRAPIGKTQAEFSREMKESGRNVVVIRDDADPNKAKRGVMSSGFGLTFLSIVMLYWAGRDFRRLSKN